MPWLERSARAKVARTLLPIPRWRAKSILAALEAGLDFDRGGTLATTLCGIYRAMQRQLANTPNDVEKLNEVRSGVANLAESWRALVA